MGVTNEPPNKRKDWAEIPCPEKKRRNKAKSTTNVTMEPKSETACPIARYVGMRVGGKMVLKDGKMVSMKYKPSANEESSVEEESSSSNMLSDSMNTAAPIEVLEIRPFKNPYFVPIREKEKDSDLSSIGSD